MWKTALSVLRKVGRTDLAEDAVMQAMQSLIAAQPPPDIRNSEALLVCTAKRKAIDMARAHDILRRASTELHDDDLLAEGIEADTVVRLDRQQTVQRALVEVAALPQVQQQIIRKVIMEERTAKHVATELGVSPARVSQLRTAALITLRDRLGKGSIA
jgi:RNA polymerase sigma-70 factor (ECF subfamily)